MRIPWQWDAAIHGSVNGAFAQLGAILPVECTSSHTRYVPGAGVTSEHRPENLVVLVNEKLHGFFRAEATWSPMLLFFFETSYFGPTVIHGGRSCVLVGGQVMGLCVWGNLQMLHIKG